MTYVLIGIAFVWLVALTVFQDSRRLASRMTNIESRVRDAQEAIEMHGDKLWRRARRDRRKSQEARNLLEEMEAEECSSTS